MDINNGGRHTGPFVNACPGALNVSPSTSDETEADDDKGLEFREWEEVVGGGVLGCEEEREKRCGGVLEVDGFRLLCLAIWREENPSVCTTRDPFTRWQKKLEGARNLVADAENVPVKL